MIRWVTILYLVCFQNSMSYVVTLTIVPKHVERKTRESKSVRPNVLVSFHTKQIKLAEIVGKAVKLTRRRKLETHQINNIMF